MFLKLAVHVCFSIAQVASRKEINKCRGPSIAAVILTPEGPKTSAKIVNVEGHFIVINRIGTSFVFSKLTGVQKDLLPLQPIRETLFLKY